MRWLCASCALFSTLSSHVLIISAADIHVQNCTEYTRSWKNHAIQAREPRSAPLVAISHDFVCLATRISSSERAQMNRPVRRSRTSCSKYVWNAGPEILVENVVLLRSPGEPIRWIFTILQLIDIIRLAFY